MAAEALAVSDVHANDTRHLAQLREFEEAERLANELAVLAPAAKPAAPQSDFAVHIESDEEFEWIRIKRKA